MARFLTDENVIPIYEDVILTYEILIPTYRTVKSHPNWLHPTGSTGLGVEKYRTRKNT